MKDRLVIVAPPEFKLDESLKKEASRFGIKLVLVPLNMLSSDLVHKARQRIFAQSMDEAGLRYPEHVIREYGPPDQYKHLLPKSIQAQLISTKS